MNLLLVNAPYPRASKFFGQPTSLLYAATLCIEWAEKNGHHVELINFNAWDPSDFHERGHNFFRERIDELTPQMLGISLTSASWTEAKGLARTAKDCNVPWVLFGGPHEDDTLVKSCRTDNNVDISVSGDGESAFLFLTKLILSADQTSANALAKALTRESDANRVYGESTVQFSSGDTVRLVEGDCGSIPLDELPFLARRYLSQRERYFYPIFCDHQWVMKATTEVMTQRGCIAKCDFCSESEKLRLRSLSRVVDELGQIQDDGYQAVFFDDSTFTNRSSGRREFVRGLCDELGQLSIEWGCQTRIDSIDEPIARDLRNGGCTYVYFGIETADQSLLRSLGKKYSMQDVKQKLKLCHDYGIRVGASLILGSPDANHKSRETMDTAKATFRFVREHAEFGPIILASVNLFGYYPGTLATLAYESRYPGTITPDTWTKPAFSESYPFSLLEEYPSLMPMGLIEEAPAFLELADEMIGDLLIGQDKYSANARFPF